MVKEVLKPSNANKLVANAPMAHCRNTRRDSRDSLGEGTSEILCGDSLADSLKVDTSAILCGILRGSLCGYKPGQKAKGGKNTRSKK